VKRRCVSAWVATRRSNALAGVDCCAGLAFAFAGPACFPGVPVALPARETIAA